MRNVSVNPVKSVSNRKSVRVSLCVGVVMCPSRHSPRDHVEIVVDIELFNPRSLYLRTKINTFILLLACHPSTLVLVTAAFIYADMYTVVLLSKISVITMSNSHL